MSRPCWCPISRKMSKIPSTARAHLMTARINLSIFAILIFFSDDLYKCLLPAAAFQVSDSTAVFVTCTALLHSLLFITLIPHFNSHFEMYSAFTMTTDNWNERNKCYHPPSQFIIRDNWLKPPPKLEMRLGIGFECLSQSQASHNQRKCFPKNKYEGVCVGKDERPEGSLWHVSVHTGWQ